MIDYDSFEKNIMDTAVIPYSGNAEAVFITSELLKNDTSKIFIKKNWLLFEQML